MTSERGRGECASPTDRCNTATYGALARYAFDVGAWGNSRWSVFLGASGHPGSPHYADQHAMWAACRMAPMVADWPALEADAEARQTLWP